MAISLISKMLGSGLQVDRGSSSNTRNVYVPPSPQSTHGEGYPYPYRSPPFIGTWKDMENKGPLGMGIKKKPKGKGLLLEKNSPFNGLPILGTIL